MGLVPQIRTLGVHQFAPSIKPYAPCQYTPTLLEGLPRHCKLHLPSRRPRPLFLHFQNLRSGRRLPILKDHPHRLSLLPGRSTPTHCVIIPKALLPLLHCHRPIESLQLRGSHHLIPAPNVRPGISQAKPFHIQSRPRPCTRHQDQHPQTTKPLKHTPLLPVPRPQAKFDIQ